MVDYSNIPRDSRRVPLETRVQFKFDRFSGFISEYSANISPGGLFLRTRNPRPPGTVVDFEFRLGDGFELIKGRGEVIWVRAEDEGPARPAGMGMHFLELSEGSRDLIYRIVDQHILQGGTPFDVTQKPPDSVPARPAAPEPFPGLLEPPPAPPRRPLEPAPLASPAPPGSPASDTASWLPVLEGLGSGRPPAAEPFPELLSPPVAEPAPASPPPMFAASLGGAALHRSPRRLLPWALLAAALALAAGAFLLRGRLMEWIGPGAEEKAVETAPPGRTPAAAPGRPAAASPPAAGGAPQAPAAGAVTTAPAPPRPAAAAPAAPAASPPLTRLDRITSKRTAGGTEIVLWGNGEIPAASYRQARIEGNPPRELFRLAGVRGSQPQTRLVVGTGEVLQVRTGYHPEAGKGELHVVLDLVHPSVRITGIEQGPRQLRIRLQRR